MIRESEMINKVDGKKSQETVQLLTFQLSTTWYGLKIEGIREIIKISKITWVPGTASYVVGVINHRGMIIPILDIRELLGLGKSEITEESRIIIVEVENVSTGLGVLVDNIADMVFVPASEIVAIPLTMDKRKTRYVIGEVRIEEKLIGILDIHTVSVEESKK
ncbi:chemotaxis protein CheW [bacterium]|nr:chemotaxis protein CheW [bacterium]MBU1753667.1 chemotaxis protein CheW [bacterium]